MMPYLCQKKAVSQTSSLLVKITLGNRVVEHGMETEDTKETRE